MSPRKIMFHNDVKDESIPTRKSLYSLERSLAPLWKLTYYGCLLFDWCRPIQRGCCLTTVLRSVAIALTLTLTLIQLGFAAVDLIWAISDPKNQLKDIVTPLSYFCIFPMVVLTWLQLLLRRPYFLDFFGNWVKLEHVTPAESLNHSAIKKMYSKTYAVYGVISCCFMLFTIYKALFTELEELGNIFVMRSVSQLLNSTWFSFIYRVAFAFGYFSFDVMFAAADIVPIFVYYQAAKHVEALERDIQIINQETKTNIGDFPSTILSYDELCLKIKAIWSRFEDLRMLIQRADQLLGPIVILNHGTSFFLICCEVFSLFNCMKSRGAYALSIDSDEKPAVPVVALVLFLIANLLRLFFSIFPIAKIHKNCDLFVTAVARLSSSMCCSLNKQERRLTRSFLDRVQSAGLVACPAGFYTITPSVLLTLLSLIITYTIILLQQT